MLDERGTAVPEFDSDNYCEMFCDHSSPCILLLGHDGPHTAHDGCKWSENDAQASGKGVTMGREVRRVPPDWEHPRDARGNFLPMYDESFEHALRVFKEERAAHERSNVFFAGCIPDEPGLYRPDWPDEARTAWQVYETTSAGTPVSPVFACREDLEHWIHRRSLRT